jgi:O-antigen ligase
MLALLFVCYCVFFIQSLSNLFLLDNQYRGIDTGFVGREEHWENAWNVFLQYPLFGIGFGYFRPGTGTVTPHSMWLGMLSMMGLMSIFILIAMLQNGWRIYRTNIIVFLLLLSFIPMTIFNDRFVNLNPYPFLFFILLFLPSKALRVGNQARELRAVRHRGIGPRRGLETWAKVTRSVAMDTDARKN